MEARDLTKREVFSLLKGDYMKTPEYYKADGFEFDVIDFCKAYSLNFCLGNVVKYIVRAGKKDGEDKFTALSKAKNYLDYEVNCALFEIAKEKIAKEKEETTRGS